MSRPRLLAAVVATAGLSAVMGSIVPASAATIIQSRGYVAGSAGDVISPQCLTLTDTEYVDIAGACFALPAGSTDFTVNVEDSNSPAVGFEVSLLNAAGSQIGAVQKGCGSMDVVVQSGAISVKVAIDGPLTGPADCKLAQLNGMGTTGTIELVAHA